MIRGEGVGKLSHQRPEWSPWLSIVGEALREAWENRWDAMVPNCPEDRQPHAPLLSGATIEIGESAVRVLWRRLLGLAAESGSPKLAGLKGAISEQIDAPALFEASLCQDKSWVDRLATTTGASAETLEAVVALVSLPFLQACNRRWASTLPTTWVDGYCPVCASWPAFAEVRGIERSRYCRCGRCGSEWYSELLHCGYCGSHDHDEFVSLVPQKSGVTGEVEACRRCHGYLKVFTSLQGRPPSSVILKDLGSVDLDLAALEHGYARPVGPGCAMKVTVVTAASPLRRLFAWNA